MCFKYQFRNDIFDRHLIGIFEFTSERAVSKNDEKNESKSRFDRNDFETIPKRHRCAFVLNSLMTSESGGAVTQPFKTSAATSPAYISEPTIIPVPPPSGYAKEIENLKKLYKNDMKYEGNDDHFVHKLSIFHHLCFKADVSHEVKSKAFSSMFKNHALNYYLANINMLKNASLNQTCTFISIHFENPDYKKNNFTK